MSKAAVHDVKMTGAVMRSSCRYCRRRRIRCSGESPCSACVSRRLDCVHDQRAKMGRPTKDAATNTTILPRRTITLGTLLDAAFHDAFVSDVPTTSFSAAARTYLTQFADTLTIDAEALAEKRPCGPDVYAAMLALSVAQTLDACRWHFSVCPITIQGSPGRGRRPTFLPVSLLFDETKQMMRHTTQQDYQARACDAREFKSLFRTWSTVHPLAPCVDEDAIESDESAAGRAMRLLIAFEARQMRGEEEETEGEHDAEYAHASHLLRNHCIDVFDDEERVLKTQHDLLIACQACILFGWYEQSHIHSKRGMSYIAVIGQLLSRLQTLAEGDSSSTTARQTITLSSYFSLLTVWAFSQLDRSTGIMGQTWSFSAMHKAQSLPAEAVLMDAAARLCSILLDANASSGPKRSMDLAIGLEAQIASIALPNGCQSDDVIDMVEVIRSSLRLILLLPANCQASHVQQSQSALLDIYNATIPRIARLVGPSLSSKPASNSHVLAQMPFSHQSSLPPKPDGREPMRKVVGAYAFELFAQIVEQIVSRTSERSWSDVCFSLSAISTSLIESPTVQVARQMLLSSAQRSIEAQTSASSTPSLISVGETISSQNSPGFSMPSLNVAVEGAPIAADSDGWSLFAAQDEVNVDQEAKDPLYALLWGFLPTDMEENEAI